MQISDYKNSEIFVCFRYREPPLRLQSFRLKIFTAFEASGSLPVSKTKFQQSPFFFQTLIRQSISSRGALAHRKELVRALGTFSSKTLLYNVFYTQVFRFLSLSFYS